MSIWAPRKILSYQVYVIISIIHVHEVLDRIYSLYNTHACIDNIEKLAKCYYENGVTILLFLRKWQMCTIDKGT